MNVPWNVVSTVLSIIISVLLALALYILNDLSDSIDTLERQRREDKMELTAKIDEAVQRVQARQDQSNQALGQQIERSVSQAETRQQQALGSLERQMVQGKNDINAKIDSQETRINGQLDRQSQEQRGIISLIYTSSQEQLERIARLEENVRPFLPGR